MLCQGHILLREAPRIMRRPVYIDRAEPLIKIPLLVKTCIQGGNNGREYQGTQTTVIVGWCFLAALSAAITFTKL